MHMVKCLLWRYDADAWYMRDDIDDMHEISHGHMRMRYARQEVIVYIGKVTIPNRIL